jgi:hypothetical protein
VARIITGNIIIPNKPIYRRLAVDEIEVLTKDMNKSYCIEIESWFLNILLSQLLRIIT